MATINLNLDAQPIKVAAESLSEQLGRLGALLEALPLDHPARLFELPLGDLWQAISQADMLAETVKGDALRIVPHPVLVNFGGLIGAICDGLDAQAKAEAVAP